MKISEGEKENIIEVNADDITSIPEEIADGVFISKEDDRIIVVNNSRNEIKFKMTLIC